MEQRLETDGQNPAATPGLMDFAAVRDAFLRGLQVILLMRHAERPPLDPTDTSFGAQLPITAAGRAAAVRLGVRIRRELNPSRVEFFASETLRTVQTAECLRAGLLDGGVEADVAEVRHEPVLGGASPFFGSLKDRMALIAEGRYLDRLNDYYRIGTQRGYYPLRPSVRQMERYLCARVGAACGLSIAVTHDVNVASFLAGWGVWTVFTSETWPHYLDAAVIIRSEDGSVVRRGYLRHEES